MPDEEHEYDYVPEAGEIAYRSPEEEQLRLNLTFVPTRSLIEELVRRVSPCVFVYTLTDRRLEAAADPDMITEAAPEGGEYLHIRYGGRATTAAGMTQWAYGRLMQILS